MRKLYAVLVLMAFLSGTILHASRSFEYMERYSERELEYLLVWRHELARHHRWLAIRLLWDYRAHVGKHFFDSHGFPVLGNEVYICHPDVRQSLKTTYIQGCYIWARGVYFEPASRDIVVVEGVVYDYPVTKYLYLSDLNAYIYLDNHTFTFALESLVPYAIAFTTVYVKSLPVIYNFREALIDSGYLRKFPVIELPSLFNELERVYGIKADLIAISNYTETILIVAPAGGSCVGCYERKVIWEIVERHTGVNVTGYLVYVYIHRYHTLHSDPVLYKHESVFTVEISEHTPYADIRRYYGQLVEELSVEFKVYNKVVYVYTVSLPFDNFTVSYWKALELLRAFRNITKPEVEIVYVARRLHDIPEGVSFTPVQVNFRVPACARPVKPPKGQWYFDYLLDYYPLVNRSEPLPQPITENIHCPEGWSLRGYETKPPEFTETTPATAPVRPPGVSPTEVIQAKDETQNPLKYIVTAVVVAVLGLVSWYVLSRHFSTKETAP